MRTKMDIPYASWENGCFDLYLPEETPRAGVIWFHGGGLAAGDRKGIRFAQQLTSAGVAVASVEYRMYPEARFPEFLEDAAASVAYILERRKALGLPEKIYVSGQSAGAWITLMLAMDTHYLEDAGVDRASIAGWISDSAQITAHFKVLANRGLDSRLERVDEAAPLYFLTADCPLDDLLLIWYTEDMPCRPEQNRLFLRCLKRFFPERNLQGLELPGKHCSGSGTPNDRGTYDYADALLAFIGE